MLRGSVTKMEAWDIPSIVHIFFRFFCTGGTEFAFFLPTFAKKLLKWFATLSLSPTTSPSMFNWVTVSEVPFLPSISFNVCHVFLGLPAFSVNLFPMCWVKNKSQKMKWYEELIKAWRPEGREKYMKSSLNFKNLNYCACNVFTMEESGKQYTVVFA